MNRFSFLLGIGAVVFPEMLVAMYYNVPDNVFMTMPITGKIGYFILLSIMIFVAMKCWICGLIILFGDGEQKK